MTALLLDIGNSRLKWALLRRGAIRESGAIEHGGDPAAVLSGLPLPPEIRGSIAWAANVTGPAHATALTAVARQSFDIELRFAAVRAECRGLRVAYADPGRLGIDRWLQMLALWHEHRGTFVVASAGTALTFDAVDAGGQHLGGIIAPGLLTAQQAVLGATRFAARGPDLEYSSGLGRDTEACVRQGALHACAGLIERLAAHYAPGDGLRVLSGGDAVVLRPQLAGEWLMRSDLVFEGLRLLATE